MDYETNRVAVTTEVSKNHFDVYCEYQKRVIAKMKGEN